MGTQLTLNSKDNLVRELLSTFLKHNFHKYLTKLKLRSCCINLDNLSRNLIYEQLFNKFTNVLFIKTSNKNIFIYLSMCVCGTEGGDRNGVKQSLTYHDKAINDG